MISLKEVFKTVLKEQPQAPQAAQPATPGIPQTPDIAQTMDMDQGKQGRILDFQKKQFTVSIFAEQRKIILSPKKGAISPSDLRRLVNELKNNFKTTTVKSLQDGVFEVQFSASEDMGVISDFIQRFVDEQS